VILRTDVILVAAVLSVTEVTVKSVPRVGLPSPRLSVITMICDAGRMGENDAVQGQCIMKERPASED
jgi:hypothetical protein